MNRWLALLRAVNVGGTGKLLMDDLSLALTAAGLQDVNTHLASGNVVFRSDLDETELVPLFNDILQNRFGLKGERTLLRSAPVLSRVIKLNPFPDAARLRPDMLHVHFLSAPPAGTAELNLTSYKGPERLRLDGQQLYIDYPNGAGQSALTTRFLDTALASSGTARNWSTILKLADMLKQ